MAEVSEDDRQPAYDCCTIRLAFFIDSLRIKEENGDRRGLSLTLYFYALSILRQSYAEHAAILLATSLEIRAELGIGGLPVPKTEHEDTIAVLTAQLGPERFAEASARGRELFDEVVDAA